MKKQKRLLVPLFIIAFGCFISSCKKQSTSSAQCRITDIKINDKYNSEIKLEYNADKKLSIVTYTPLYGRRILTYKDNFIFVMVVDSNWQVNALDTVSLNSEGLINSIWFSNYPSSSSPAYDSFFYDSKGEVIQYVDGSPGWRYPTNYGWDNGDMISDSREPGTVPEYYADKKAADGDYLRISDFIDWGLPIYKCNHLYKGGKSYAYSYAFDSDGKIISLLNNGKEVYRYSYACD